LYFYYKKFNTEKENIVPTLVYILIPNLSESEEGYPHAKYVLHTEKQPSLPLCVTTYRDSSNYDSIQNVLQTVAQKEYWNISAEIWKDKFDLWKVKDENLFMKYLSNFQYLWYMLMHMNWCITCIPS